MTPEEKLRKIVEEVDGFACWWDQPDDIGHHDSCQLYTDDGDISRVSFPGLFEYDDDDEVYTLVLSKAAHACECWLGAAWRIRELTK